MFMQAAVEARMQGIAIAYFIAAFATMAGTNLWFLGPLLQWQAFPPASPLASSFAIFSACVMLGCATALLAERTRLAGSALAAIWLTAWTVCLQIPVMFEGGVKGIVGVLGAAEIGAAALGVAALTTDVRKLLAWRLGFALCLVIFGLSHFLFATVTASMVPSWIPFPLAVAYGIALRWKVRAAAAIEAAQMTCFVLLLHLPETVLSGGARRELTALGIAMLLSASVWLAAIAHPLRQRRVQRTDQPASTAELKHGDGR
jgi:hypothetical protein